MDSFLAAASDLDSILDQFERNEDSTSLLQPEPMTANKAVPHQYVTSQSPQIVNGTSLYHLETGQQSKLPVPETSQDGHKSTEFLIDLSEADFAPAVSSALSINTRMDIQSSSESNEHQQSSKSMSEMSRLDRLSNVYSVDDGALEGRTSNTMNSILQSGGTTDLHKPLVSDQHTMVSLENVQSCNTPANSLSSSVNNGNTGSAQTSLASQSLHDGVGQHDMAVEVNKSKNDDRVLEKTECGKDDKTNVTKNSGQEVMQEKGGVETSTMSLSKAMTPAPLRPELMHEYVKQGARPKIITKIKTQESPVKAVSDISTLSKPIKGGSQPKAAVGFGNVTSVKVTDADLEALEQEVGIMSAQDKNKPLTQPVFPSVDNHTQLKPKHLNVQELHNPSDRVSPVSKLLHEQFVKSQHRPQQNVSQGNELLGLDPFYSQDSAVTAPTPPHTVPDLSSMPGTGSVHSNMSLTPTHVTPRKVEMKDNVLPNDVRSKNAKNLLRNNQSLPGRPYVNKGPVEDLSAQINNSNSQVKMPNVVKGDIPDTTSLQGLSPALSASTGTHKVQPEQQPGHQPDHQKYGKNINQQSGFPSPSHLNNAMDQTHSLGSTPAPPFMPADPPSYQDVRMSVETEKKADNLRQGLSLNFDQSSSRKVAQALPPSPIIENAVGREEAFRVVEETPPSEQSTLVDVKPPTFHTEPQVRHPQGEVSAAPPVSAPNAVSQNNQLQADNDSMTPSNETDSEEGEFSHRVMDYSEGFMQLGAVAPVWVPDSEALNCMNCQQKFTFRKRRHHCRACGKVFCAKCCSMRLKLKYMESKEARVCISCLNVILRAQALKRSQGEIQQDPQQQQQQQQQQHQQQQQQQQQQHQQQQQQQQPDQNNQGNLHEAAGSGSNRSSLRRPSSDGSRSRETRKVRFSDGLNPGVDTGHHAIPDSQSDKVPIGMEVNTGPFTGVDGRPQEVVHRSLIPINADSLPPVIVATEVKGEYKVHVNPVADELIQEMRNASAPAVVFAVNKNLLVRTKILDLNCCVNRTCWCFSTKGMATVGQDEIVIVLECLPDEKNIPKDIFFHLQSLYEQASTGVTVSHMGHSIFSQSFLGGREHGGFLYLRPSFQCLGKLLLPESPYLFAVLLQKWETPWAKVFPLRLLLRLGAEFRYYPCPLMSVRFRKPVFGEIGHTIMNLLADFKNYQYKLPVIPGIVIHMQDRETLIKIPRNRYDEVMKVVNNSNEHVMAIAANFSTESDSHLVCIQNDEGTYHTQAISIQNKPRKVTGASFVVFNGALKTTSGLTAKSSIVEDGLMIQILPETMAALRQALREMLDLPIPCGNTQAEQPDETVTVTWIDEDKAVNMGVISPIDHRSLEGIASIRIHNGTDYRGRSRSLRWTEVFFLENNESPVDLSRLAEMLSAAFCVALTSQLDELREAAMTKLALRVTVDSDKVGYEAGSKGELLPPVYMNELDNELIPVLHNAVSQHEGGPVVMELVFYIIE